MQLTASAFVVFTVLFSYPATHSALADSLTNSQEDDLRMASRDGRIESVRALLKRGISVDSPTSSGRTALMFAAQSGQSKIVALLLDAGANPDLTDDRDHTPLMLASKNCFTKAVEVLLAKRPDLNRRNSVGRTALILSSENACAKVVELLAAAPGIDFRVEDDWGKNAFEYASENQISGYDNRSIFYLKPLMMRLANGQPVQTLRP